MKAVSELFIENAGLKQRIDHDLISSLESSVAKKFEELSDKTDLRLHSEPEPDIHPTYAKKAPSERDMLCILEKIRTEGFNAGCLLPVRVTTPFLTV